MARIGKLSAVQFQRFLKQIRDDDAHITVTYVIADETEELLMETSLGDARASPDEWATLVVEAIADHSDAQSMGAHKYVARARRLADPPESGRLLGSSWARVIIRRGKTDDDSADDGLDGSVGSFVSQLQRTIEFATRTNAELTKTVVGALQAQGQMVAQVFERQRELEKERAELVAENLEQAAAAALADKTKTDADEDPFRILVKELGPLTAHAVVDKVAKRLAPQITAFMSSLADDDEEGSTSKDDAPAKTIQAEVVDAPAGD